ncbi:hypothetical protein LINGRAHAP2_LOCUS30075, partial [Linum grandiflorum]
RTSRFFSLIQSLPFDSGQRRFINRLLQHFHHIFSAERGRKLNFSTFMFSTIATHGNHKVISALPFPPEISILLSRLGIFHCMAAFIAYHPS